MKPIVDELGNVASSSQEKADLFANRLQQTYQEPDYRGFDGRWKDSVEGYLRENKDTFTTEGYLDRSI